MKEKDFFEEKYIPDEGEDDDISWQESEMHRGMNSAIADTALEVGHDSYLEEEHYIENTADMKKRIESINLRIEKIEEALVYIQSAYEGAKSGEKAGFRSMVAAGRYALQRAEQDLLETSEALGEINLD